MRKLAFLVCLVGMLATGYGMITYGLKCDTSHAFLCSCGCALYLWSLFNLYPVK